MNKKDILILAVVLGIMAFIHYELLMERNQSLMLFCESEEGDSVAEYGPECYNFMKTSFK